MSTNSGDAARRRLSRRVLKKNSRGHRPTLDFPDRFKDLQDDADEDVIPPSQGHNLFMNMNQSIFGLIAAAGSNVDFNDRFEGQSSDEDDNHGNKDEDMEGNIETGRKQNEQLAKTTILKKSSSGKEKGRMDEKHRYRIPRQLLQSLPQLPRLGTHPPSNRSKLKPFHFGTSDPTDGKKSPTHTAGSQSDATEADETDREERLAPVMSRILEARAEMSSRPSFELEGLSRDPSEEEATGPSALAQKLKEIFEFDHPEEVIQGLI
jgi:sterol 3beta-glucosyltransferase